MIYDVARISIVGCPSGRGAIVHCDTSSWLLLVMVIEIMCETASRKLLLALDLALALL